MKMDAVGVPNDFFLSQTLTFDRFAVPWVTRIDSIYFEIPDKGATRFIQKREW